MNNVFDLKNVARDKLHFFVSTNFFPSVTFGLINSEIFPYNLV